MLEGQSFRPNSPFGQFLNIVPMFDRSDIAGAIDLLIEKLDRQDGDPDLEECGLEDGFQRHAADGPGCPLSDSDHCEAKDDTFAHVWDGLPGDDGDAEDGGDTELNGDEADYSAAPNWEAC